MIQLIDDSIKDDSIDELKDELKDDSIDELKDDSKSIYDWKKKNINKIYFFIILLFKLNM